MNMISIVAAIIGIGVGILTLIKEWSVIVSATTSFRNKLRGVVLPSIQRRNIIIAFAIGGASVVTFAAWLKWQVILPVIRPIKRQEIGDVFLKNVKSGTIHHVKACAAHLPKKVVVVDSSEISLSEKIHASKLPQIASLAFNDLGELEREKLIINAITKNPTSTHLFKYLIKDWGRRKEYSRIFEFLEANIDYLNSMRSRYIKNVRLQKKYSKAIVELKQRRDRAKYLASIAQLS